MWHRKNAVDWKLINLDFKKRQLIKFVRTSGGLDDRLDQFSSALVGSLVHSFNMVRVAEHDLRSEAIKRKLRMSRLDPDSEGQKVHNLQYRRIEE